ncbi:MAG: aminotransferase class V-fold PLP-dependent enzyme [Bryobacterales bacterium]|nr:aminotransferase class V-fold PLP-dependent enzyme [Bryobacterales bacterium]
MNREWMKSDWMKSAIGKLTRRQLFQAGAAAGMASQLQARKALYEDSIYERLLGVKPILTCRGHTTAFGGSLMPEPVMRAMQEANDVFVDMQELQAACGKRIAAIMKTESAMVSAGSFSAMLLGCAACLTGKDQARIEALPHPTWPKREVLVQKAHRVGYDRAYRAAGATLREFETKAQLERAIGEKTVMLAALASTEQNRSPAVMTIQEYIDLGKRHGVPVLVDCASELPPASNLNRWIGADLVVFSGGKGILGPQSSGILAGRKDLIDAAVLNATPNANIGRGMKVGKEEMVGLVVALELYAARDHVTIQESWNKKAQYMAAQLQGIRGFKAAYRLNKQEFGEVRIDWDRAFIPITGKEAARKLFAGEPRLMYYDDDEGGILQTRSMKDGDEILAARRLRDFFTAEGRKA